MICSFGCNQEATHFIKHSKRWCCSLKASSCVAVRQRNSERQRKGSEIDVKKRQTFVQKYGTNHPMQNSDVKQKHVYTVREKFGVDNVFSNVAVQIKIKDIHRSNHGVEFASLIPSKIEKTKNTFAEKWGGHPMQNSDVKQKHQDTLNANFGVMNAGQTPNAISAATKPKTIESNIKRRQTWADKTPEEISNIISKREKTSGFRTPFLNPNVKRSRSTVSKKEKRCLDNLNVPIRQFYIKDLGIIVDGYNPDTNTVYLFHGDYWHGNPLKFNPEAVNKSTKTTFGELYQKTIDYENKIVDYGFNLVVVWETENEICNTFCS